LEGKGKKAAKIYRKLLALRREPFFFCKQFEIFASFSYYFCFDGERKRERE
jgi:hypothetical protein